MSSTLEIEPPEFNPSKDSGDVEIFCLRAPAHFDVSEILNGVTLNFDSNFLKSPTSMLTSDIISRFKAGSNDREYSLSLVDPSESEGMRLLVPDTEDQDKLIPFGPFKGQFNLTAEGSGLGENISDGPSNIQTDLLLAPAEDRAPKPAFEQSGNGAVDKMRLAYVHVPQRDGLKRRWAMPGSCSTPRSVGNKRNLIKEEVDVGGDELPKSVRHEDTAIKEVDVSEDKTPKRSRSAKKAKKTRKG